MSDGDFLKSTKAIIEPSADKIKTRLIAIAAAG